MILDVIAPAKINWFLRIIGQREDGYHLLETVFQSISLVDEIRLTLGSSFGAREGRIRCICRPATLKTSCQEYDNDSLNGLDNLAYKAADLLSEALTKKKTPCPAMTIDIRKHIPLQAGLAGGSSDAAVVLRGFNSMLGFPLGQDELWELACRCGADTAFCLKGGTQWGEGTGSELTPWPDAPDWPVVIVKPTRGVSTKKAFAAYDELPARISQQTSTREDWRQALAAGDISRVAAMMSNDLEPVSLALCPEIADVKKELLKAGCLAALMSGSGSSVMGLVSDAAAQADVVRSMSEKGFTGVWAVRTKV